MSGMKLQCYSRFPHLVVNTMPQGNQQTVEHRLIGHMYKLDAFRHTVYENEF